MVICCGRLVVVSSIPPGDFFFVFCANLLFFGAQRRAARDFGGPEKAIDGAPLIGRIGCPNAKSRAPGAENRPFCVCPAGTRGRFFWAYGQIRAAGRDVN